MIKLIFYDSRSFVDWNKPSKFDVEISIYDEPKFAKNIHVTSVEQHVAEMVLEVGFDEENHGGCA